MNFLLIELSNKIKENTSKRVLNINPSYYEEVEFKNFKFWVEKSYIT